MKNLPYQYTKNNNSNSNNNVSEILHVNSILIVIAAVSEQIKTLSACENNKFAFN